MTARQCLAFLTDVTDQPWPAEVEPVKESSMVAVLGPQPPRLRVTRKALLKDAALRMQRLEALMAMGTVVPTLPATSLTAEQAALAIRANRGVLAQAAAHLRGKVQFQLCVRWAEDAAWARFQSGPAPWPYPRNAAELVGAFQRWVDDALLALGAETLALPTTPGVPVNRAVLLPAGRAPDLDALADAIDELWTEGLSIRLTGPSPAVSFASIAMRWVQPTALQQALTGLGLSSAVTEDDIQAARRRALLAGGSGAATRVARQVAMVRLAMAAGWPSGAIPELSLWSEDRASPETLRGAA